MAIKVAINGFGRIGRLVFRGALAARGIDVVAINDLTDANTLGHLLRYDSVHGLFPGSVGVLKSGFIKASMPGGKSAKVKVLSERDPAMLPWKELAVDVVVESTGLFRKRKDAAKHLAAGARKVRGAAAVPAE